MRGSVFCLLILGLAGCAQTQTVVIAAPHELFVCPDLKNSDFPKGHYKQSAVAKLLVKEQDRADKCAASLRAIHDYEEQQQKNVTLEGFKHVRATP